MQAGNLPLFTKFIGDQGSDLLQRPSANLPPNLYWRWHPPASSALVVALKNRAIQDFWCQPPYSSTVEYPYTRPILEYITHTQISDTPYLGSWQ